jgi:hypothetical protein
MDINTSSSTFQSKMNGIFVCSHYNLMINGRFSINLYFIFQIIVHHPEQYPNSGYFIPTATQTSVVIKPSYSYATDTVKKLSTEDRQCVYEVN